LLRTALGPEIATWLAKASVIKLMLNNDGRLLAAPIANTRSGISAADGSLR